DKEVFAKECELSAGEAIGGCSGEGDQVVDGQSEDVVGGRGMAGCSTNEAAGDPQWHHAAEREVGGGHIEEASDESADCDGQDELGVRKLQGDGTCCHERPQRKKRICVPVHAEVAARR